MKCGRTIELEDEYREDHDSYYHEVTAKDERGSETIEHRKTSQQKRNPNNICILYNHVPEQIILKQNKNAAAHKFIMTVDKKYRFAKQEMVDGKICLVNLAAFMSHEFYRVLYISAILLDNFFWVPFIMHSKKCLQTKLTFGKEHF